MQKTMIASSLAVALVGGCASGPSVQGTPSALSTPSMASTPSAASARTAPAAAMPMRDLAPTPSADPVSASAAAAPPASLALLQPVIGSTTLPNAPAGTIGAAPANIAAYKVSVAHKVAQANNLKPTSAAVRAITVVGYTVDRNGAVTESWIVRSSGEKTLDSRALTEFGKAQPLPAPPANIFASKLIGRADTASLSEAWVFTTDGSARLQTLSK